MWDDAQIKCMKFIRTHGHDAHVILVGHKIEALHLYVNYIWSENSYVHSWCVRRPTTTVRSRGYVCASCEYQYGRWIWIWIWVQVSWLLLKNKLTEAIPFSFLSFSRFRCVSFSGSGGVGARARARARIKILNYRTWANDRTQSPSWVINYKFCW